MADHMKNSLYRLLRWSEQYTKTDMVYFAQGTVWSIAGTVLTTLTAAVTVLAFANLLPKEVYGSYQYILATVDIFGIFVLAGMDTALGRSVARGMDGSWRDAMRVKFRWGLIGGAGSLALGAYYLLHGNTVLGGGFVVASLAIPVWELGGLYVAYTQGKKRFDLINIGDAFIQLGVSLTLVTALLLTDNVILLLTAYFLSYGLLRWIWFFVALKREPPNSARDPHMISYGKKLTFVSVMGNLATNADKIVIWHFLGPAPVAIYSFAQSIPMRAIGFLKIVNRLAFPKMAVQEKHVLRQTLMHKIWRLVAVAFAATVLYAFAAPFLFALFLPQYIDAVPYTIVVGLLIALQPFSLISSSFTAQAREMETYVWSIGTPVMRLTLFATLIPLWGLWGAVIALVGAKALESLLLVVLFYRA